MYLYLEKNFNPAKIYLDSSEVHLNLRKCIIKFLNLDIDFFKFR